MKSTKFSFDFADAPEIVTALRSEAVRSGKSQKALVIEALEAYFSHRFENRFLLRAAEQTFQEWDNPDDAVYDKL